MREIARKLGRAPSTISRELRCNVATRGGMLEYRASVAQWKAELMAQRPKTAKMVANPILREYVQDRLSGVIRGPDSAIVTGPVMPQWKGRRKPHRQDRRWPTTTAVSEDLCGSIPMMTTGRHSDRSNDQNAAHCDPEDQSFE
uniref:Transposase IS30-like HTH domain-containing protein n=1 Tax=Rhodococcus sp. NS1 TaxID=402236 RepID=A0A097SQR9_9NOCA|nr:hypothetical protein LRS1606.454 [Rhodococcus sp. NS1]